MGIVDQFMGMPVVVVSLGNTLNINNVLVMDRDTGTFLFGRNAGTAY